MIDEKENENHDTKESSTKDEVDRFLNPAKDYIRLPRKDGESIVVQFMNDKSKRQLVTTTFMDPVTQELKPQTKVKYIALDPNYPDEGEKSLEAPKTLAKEIESKIAAGYRLQKITRHGTGPNTRYTSDGA
jgi:hypothetical protein